MRRDGMRGYGGARLQLGGGVGHYILCRFLVLPGCRELLQGGLPLLLRSLARPAGAARPSVRQPDLMDLTQSRCATWPNQVQRFAELC